MEENNDLVGEWALILGASSGFGAACAVELASQGMNIFGVHLDRKSTLPQVEDLVQTLRGMGREAVFVNANAADAEKRNAIIDSITEKLTGNAGNGRIRVLLHSLAFGTLRLFIAEDHAKAVTKAQVDMTIDVMANSLVYWVQDLVARKLMGKGGRIFALTSAGGAKVWPNYGAVSAAKAALESHIRQLALELAPVGVTANAIMAGVTDTPALRKIPGSTEMLERALQKNPSRRLTTPDDVAKALAVLSHSNTQWMTGNVIAIDGGEFIVG
ncbi:MAG TPA: SDR family oxidoreductase [Nitrospirales bacterium]|nr:SDR family oxidoreductase [Nitrospirales bacterium]HIB55215.1 SDR family oxidoreductase [Nitrospirales bacterium]HIN33936.1 SDR family oxidoreductase [Nitrospirales bacterium]